MHIFFSVSFSALTLSTGDMKGIGAQKPMHTYPQKFFSEISGTKGEPANPRSLVKRLLKRRRWWHML